MMLTTTEIFVYIIVIILIIILSISLATYVKKNESSSSSNIPLVTLTCNSSQTPRPIDLPSSFPFNLETTSLGSGAFTLLYYSDIERTQLIDAYLGETTIEIQKIDPAFSGQIKAMSYIFLCSKVDVPISTTTPSPVAINPYIPYVFRNASISDILMVSVSGPAGSQTLPSITAGNTGFPNPPTGWDSYMAMVIP